MLDDIKNFEQEIKALPKLLAEDSLSLAEIIAGKEKLMLAISVPASATEPAVRYTWTERHHIAIRYIVSILLGLSLVGGTSFAASGSAQPGDILYPVKLAKEKVQLSLAGSEDSKTQLKARFAQERLNELHLLSVGLGGKAPENSNPAQTATGTVSVGTQVILETEQGENGNPSTAPATTTPDRKKIRIRAEAEAEAEAEVNSALEDLRKLQVKLKAGGDNKGAAGIETNILNLQSQAQAENIKVEQEYDQSGGQGGVEGTSTINTDVKNNGNHGDKHRGDDFKNGAQATSTISTPLLKIIAPLGDDGDGGNASATPLSIPRELINDD